MPGSDTRPAVMDWPGPQEAASVSLQAQPFDLSSDTPATGASHVAKPASLRSPSKGGLSAAFQAAAAAAAHGHAGAGPYSMVALFSAQSSNAVGLRQLRAWQRHSPF